MTSEEIVRGLNRVGSYFCAKHDQAVIAAAVDRLTPSKWDRIFEDKWYFVCDKCGAKHLVAYDYCPSCGSDMREIL